ncbi:MAG: hypothetical protein MZV70_16055 [Desulfobacterales bacterium]|nr:hypothetical protein [Desulfobacterales bacterium]
MPQASTPCAGNIAAVNPKAVVVDAASVIAIDNPGRGPRQAGARRRGRPDAHPRRDEDRRGGGGRRASSGRPAWSTRGPTWWAGSRRPSRPTRTSAPCCRPWATATEQLRDLEATINRTPCDAVVIGTPIDLNRIIKIKKPTTRVYYNLQEIGKPDLEMAIDECIRKRRHVREKNS